MKTVSSRYLCFLLVPLIAIGLAGCASDDDEPLLNIDSNGTMSVNLAEMRLTLEALPVGELSDIESEGILYMREEEKLARDVYLHLHDVWGLCVFDNISDSEQTHTDTMLLLVERYQLTDPVGDNGFGVFTNATLQQLYNDLVAQGNASLIDALKVGAMIEEVDLIDIARYIADVENNDDIVLVYENLMKGSRNHLRAFVRNLENQGIDYVPLYLDTDEYERIINSPMEH